MLTESSKDDQAQEMIYNMMGRFWVAAICAGPIALKEHLSEGHRLTSHPSVADELKEKEVDYVDDETVVVDKDNMLITRFPLVLSCFYHTLLKTLVVAVLATCLSLLLRSSSN